MKTKIMIVDDDKENLATMKGLLEKEGYVIMDYPLSSIWDLPDIKHPISCYFYLQKMNSDRTSKIIAKSERINYME